MPQFFSKKQYQQVAELFGLGAIRGIITYFRKGYQTPKVAVETGRGKFIIAKHNLSTKKTIISDMKIVPRIALVHEIQFLNTLKNLPVPHYLHSKHRRYLEDFGGYTVSVYKFLPGHEPKRMTSKMVYELGRFVGALHAQSSRFKKPMKGRRRFYDLNPRVMTLMYCSAKQQTHPLLKKAVEEVRRGVERNRLPHGLPKGPIHVDIKPDNELFIGEKLAGIVDFGNVYVDSLVFDVGKTIMWNCCAKDQLDTAMTKKFLQGYLAKRKLNNKEWRYLEQATLFAIYSHVWVDLYHIPLKYVPESYTLFLVKTFLPIARSIEKEHPNILKFVGMS